MSGYSITPSLSDQHLEEHVGVCSHQIVLYNDDVNTFEHVVICLVRICDQPVSVAKQIALEAHTQGRSIAYVGSHDECLDRKIKLQNEGLTCYVESI